LLRVLHDLAERLDLWLSVAHLDHGARGSAAHADAAFVVELSVSLGLPIDLGQWQPNRAGHFESDARRARYAWLTQIARARGATVVAVGHTQEDQAETILHRIVRGTGIQGLAGMPRKRLLAADPKVTLLRPLLDVPRQTIRDYLARSEQLFREDQSNAELTRTRARIRHDLLPKLEADYNLRIVQALVRLGGLAAALERSIETDLAKLERTAVVSVSADCVVLKRRFLGSLSAYLRAEVLRRTWRRVKWPEAAMSARRWQRLAALVDCSEIPGVMIGGHVMASTQTEFLVLRHLSGKFPCSELQVPTVVIDLDVPGSAVIPWANGRVISTFDTNAPRDESIDLDVVAPPLFVRAPIPGDRFEPLGMGGRSTPLAGFFRGRRVVPSSRARVPLVCDQRGIIWVVGHRIADRVKITERTLSTLGLRWIQQT
jgi:tRNA(Ile)-lysidine synthase